MNPLPLKLQAAMAVITRKEMTLDMILVSLQNPTTPEEHCISHVAADAQFWRCLIERYLDKTILTDRLDITPDKYEAFVRGCNGGVTNLYYALCDSSFLRAVIEGPSLYYHGLKDAAYREIIQNINEDSESETDEEHDFYFESPGLPIEKLSYAYVVKYNIDYDDEEDPSSAATFIWTNSEYQELMFGRLVTYVAERVHFHLENTFAAMGMDNFADGITIEGTHFRYIPDIEWIKYMLCLMFDETDQGIKLAKFRENGPFVAREFMVHVNNNTIIQNDMYYMNMFIKVAQLRF
jgi:hypothetical protein